MQRGWSFKQEAKLWLYQILAWITWDTYWFGKARGLSALKMHIETEREKMTRSLWLKVMWRDRWKCQIRSSYCTYRAEEVDHKLALFNKGYTVESNLQAACKACNRWKGTKRI